MELNEPLELKKWAEEMGYVHPANAPPADFSIFCKDLRLAALWKNVMFKLKSKEKLDHIRKNLLLSKMKNRTSNTITVSGSFGQNVQKYQELSQLKLQKEKTLEEVISCENSIKDIRNNLHKKAIQKSLLKNQIHDAQLKQQMFKLKKKDCDFFLSWLQEVNTLAKVHFPPSQTSEEEKRHATASLKKCIIAVSDFQSQKMEAGNLNFLEDQEDYEQWKRDLWHAISASVAKIPSDYLWSAIMNHVQESVERMESLSSSVESDDEIRHEILGNRQPRRNLEAMLIEALTDTIEYLVKAEELTCKLETLLENTADDIEIKKASADANRTIVKAPRKNIIEHLRSDSRTLQLKAAKQSLVEGIEELKNRSQNLFSFQGLKEEKATLARLNSQIEEVKKYVEQSLNSIKDTGSTLRNVQKSVEEELGKFAKNRSVFTNNSGSDSSGDIASSTVISADMKFASSTPAPWSKQRPPASVSFDVSTIPSDSGMADSISSVDKSASDLKEAVAALKNAVSQECKTFMKLPLDLASRNRLPSPELFSSQLESPSVIARTSKRVAQLFQVLYGVDEAQVHLALFRHLGHLRAVRLKQLPGAVSPPHTICADMTLQYLKVTAPELDSSCRRRLKDVEAVLESTEENLEEGRKNELAWIEQPMKSLIPKNIQYHGMNFEQWTENYNSYVSRLS